MLEDGRGCASTETARLASQTPVTATTHTHIQVTTDLMAKIRFEDSASSLSKWPLDHLAENSLYMEKLCTNCTCNLSRHMIEMNLDTTQYSNYHLLYFGS